MALENENLESYFNHAKKVAKLAGDILNKSYTSFHDLSDQGSTILEIETKESNDANLVTIVDKQIQDFIINYLKTIFPTHSFIGEESLTKIELTETPTWIIDPIDGTTNFVHGLPYCCVSIGLVVGRNPTIGVVYNPILGQMFSACEGTGAFLNDKRLGRSPKPVNPISQSIIGLEFGNERTNDVLDPKLETFSRVIKAPVRAIRCYGSAAMNLCMIACGVLDIYLEAGIHCWDIAAGVVIVR
jgi:fructose-1,6-bisphosphatase/inositol monophosphatase family enzyme